MKKIVLCTTIFVTIFVSLNAQQVDWKRFRYGIHTSPVWSWMRADDKNIEGTGSNWGFKLGVTGEYYMNSSFAILSGLGLGFNQGGTFITNYDRSIFWDNSDIDNRYDTLAKGTKLHYRLQYVEIPLGFRARFGSNEDSPIKFWVEAPVFTLGFVTKALGDVKGNTISPDTNDEVIRDDVKGLSLSWGMGGGIEYELATNTTVYGGLVFQRQFTDNSRSQQVLSSGKYTSKDSKTYFGALSLRLGLLF